MAEISHFFKFWRMWVDDKLPYVTLSHGGNRGSNPRGDAKGKKPRISAAFLFSKNLLNTRSEHTV
jgi:hypothetical protein